MPAGFFKLTGPAFCVGLCSLAIKPGSRPRPFHRRICIPARPPEAAPQWHIKCQKPKTPRFWYTIFGHPGPGQIFAGNPRRNADAAQNTPPPCALTKYPPLSSYSPSALPQEVHSDHVQGHSPSHSKASHLDRGTGGEAGHPRHQALCSFDGAEILRARHSYGRRPDSISLAALLGGGWQAAFR